MKTLQALGVLQVTEHGTYLSTFRQEETRYSSETQQWCTNTQWKIYFENIHLGKIHFGKIRFGKIHFGKVHFGKIRFEKIHFGKIHFEEIHFGKIHFGN